VNLAFEPQRSETLQAPQAMAGVASMNRIGAMVRSYGGLVLAIALLLVALLYFAVSRSPLDQDRILYGLIAFYRKTGFLILLLTMVCLCIWLVRTLYRIRQYDLQQRVIALAAGVLFLVAAVFSYMANVASVADMGTEFTHLSQVCMQDYLYQLALTGNADNQASFKIFAVTASVSPVIASIRSI
jgi:hypothetical protein